MCSIEVMLVLSEHDGLKDVATVAWCFFVVYLVVDIVFWIIGIIIEILEKHKDFF